MVRARLYHLVSKHERNLLNVVVKGVSCVIFFLRVVFFSILSKVRLLKLIKNLIVMEKNLGYLATHNLCKK